MDKQYIIKLARFDRGKEIHTRYIRSCGRGNKGWTMTCSYAPQTAATFASIELAVSFMTKCEEHAIETRSHFWKDCVWTVEEQN